MRVNSIQSSMHSSVPKRQHQVNISNRGLKGALKGAITLGSGAGIISGVILASGPAGWLIGGVTAIAGGLFGYDFEDKLKKNKEDKEKRKNTPPG